MFLSVTYLPISLSGNCQIELLELCIISLGLGDAFFCSLVNTNVRDTFAVEYG